MPKFIHIVTVLSLLLAVSCSQHVEKVPDDNNYSFFVAGHVYGNPNDATEGLHPPFAAQIPVYNADKSIAFGFLAGDMVYRSQPRYWTALDSQLQTFQMPVYLVAGNHDRGPELTKRLPETTYTFTQYGDTYVVLDAGSDWSLEADQLELLTKTISDAPESGHIFLIMHELLWWSPDGPYSDVRINYAPHYPGENNFISAVLPILTQADRPITLIAGDLGATSGVSSFSIDTIGKINLIATGMGDGGRDHVLRVGISKKQITVQKDYLKNSADMEVVYKTTR